MKNLKPRPSVVPPDVFIHAENDMAELNIQSHFYTNLQSEEHWEGFRSEAKLEPKSTAGEQCQGISCNRKAYGRLHLGSKGRFSCIIIHRYFYHKVPGSYFILVLIY